ncbi:MAG TPA: methylmalonyl Co-A mutase-associated GTPase MeaB [Syntrophobacteraceae bacterium]|nr:methylmalonyl Co-A mutase-associated GTPase MeaB [Syntrophobacteraceae bacterium]
METHYAEQVLGGSIRTLARLISWLEDEDERAFPVLEKLYPHTGKAYVVGITGSHGTGKSTLIGRLTRVIREQGLTVGIIAVDPSSPFTGGALLGDRVRMSDLFNDPGVYICSMATRGFLGGMAGATAEAVKVLDAFGKELILIETVGVGQDEVDIINIADTVCLLLSPGLGDAIQVMKAGVMEIADVFVVNKADRPGTDGLCREVQFSLAHRRRGAEDWIPPVLRTVAVNGVGIRQLWKDIQDHRQYQETSGRLYERRKERLCRDMLRMIHEEIFRRICRSLSENGQLDELVREITENRLDPRRAMRRLTGC